MKVIGTNHSGGTSTVAPLVGAWIESSTSVLAAQVTFVAPLVGAWIERIVRMHLVCIEQSLLL